MGVYVTLPENVFRYIWRNKDDPSVFVSNTTGREGPAIVAGGERRVPHLRFCHQNGLTVISDLSLWGNTKYVSVRGANRIAWRVCYLPGPQIDAQSLPVELSPCAPVLEPFCSWSGSGKWDTWTFFHPLNSWCPPMRLTYAFKKGIHYILEQPASSLLWRYRCVRVSCSWLGLFDSQSV